MDAARYARVQEVFLAVYALPAEEQAAAIERACEGDAALGDEVKSLLAHHREDTLFDKDKRGEPAQARAVSPDDTTDEAIGSPPGSRSFPVANWDRYEPGPFLGEGGMGRVYKARDLRLRRSVALKFIRSDDPRLIRRFFREARLQASIDHPNICKVYEVGEVQGMPYIAMAFIDGVALKQARHAMSLEQKLRAMVDVCTALQAAHRMGLIHRDIKPANIMVERQEDESFHPYIVDFGVARDISGTSGETTTGSIEGTPCYMAPEQATGGILDRRTDVYSLGATLYELLCGVPPFSGQTGMEVFMSIIARDPVPPRKIAPGIPAALETITLKCLEKDPGRRYDSAKALADDLSRYLDAEPIVARAPGLISVALKKARRHKAVVGVSAAALVLVLIATSVGISAIWSASRQAELAQKLGQDVKEIELLMRYAYALPVHDASREKARVREKMARIEADMAEVGSLAVGPSHYALGRGYLVLHEPAIALKHLRTAWDADYQRPEVELALGQALGELYREGLEEAARIGDKEARRGRERKLEEELLAPAIEHLRRVKAGEHGESPAYIEGLIAFYSKNYEEALRLAREAAEQSLWRHEGKRLEADVRTALGNASRDQGKLDEALVEYGRAASAYREARDAARSDATIHEAECEMWVQVIEVEAGRGADPKGSLDKAAAACDEALKANPGSASAFGKKAWAYSRWGTHLAKTAQDPRGAFETSIDLGKSALRLRPEDPIALDTLGTSHMAIANYKLAHGEDPRESLRQSAASFVEALKIHPTFAWAWNDLGGVFCSMGDYEAGHGLDPRPAYDRCIESMKRAAAESPSYHVAHTNEAFANAMKAQYELRSGIDPRVSADQGEAAGRRSLEINPAYSLTHEVLGILYLIRAEHDLYQGLDPAGAARKAGEAFSASILINGSAFYSHMGVALAARLVAMGRLGKGEDPTEALVRARAGQAKMAELSPAEAETRLREAQIAALSARWAARQGDARAGELFAKAEQAIERAIQSNSMNFEIFEAAADIYRFKSVWDIKRKESPTEDISKGVAAADRGLQINPSSASLLEAKGSLHLLKARAEEDPAAKGEAARQAQALLDEAFQKNPLARWVHGAMLAEIERPLP